MAYDEVHVPLFASSMFINSSIRGLFGDAAQEMDYSIGQIMDYLKEIGIENDTLVFFTSDNGPWLDQTINGGSPGPFYCGKGSTWEGGFREPAVAYWPGKIAPAVNNDMASTLDLLPTILDIVGVNLPDVTLDGISIASTLLNGSAIPREWYYYYRDHTLYAVRYNQYKAHFYTRSGFGEDPPLAHNPPLLFDLNNDYGEQWPLNTTQPIYAQIVSTIEQQASAFSKSLIPGPPELDYVTGPQIAPCCNQETDCVCGPW